MLTRVVTAELMSEAPSAGEINPTAVLIVQTPATPVAAGVAGAAILSATNRYLQVFSVSGQ